MDVSEGSFIQRYYYSVLVLGREATLSVEKMYREQILSFSVKGVL